MRRLLADRRQRYDIIFYRSGRIDISARIARALHILPNDNLDILTITYTRSIPEHFLYIRSNNLPEARLRPTNHLGQHYRCYSKTICQEIFRLSSTIGCKRLPLLCGETRNIPGIGTCITLITRNNHAAEY